MKDLLKEENQKYNEYDDCGCLFYVYNTQIYLYFYQGGKWGVTSYVNAV